MFEFQLKSSTLYVPIIIAKNPYIMIILANIVYIVFFFGSGSPKCFANANFSSYSLSHM